MRLPRIFRTTSFRLTLVYAALFCASVLLIFGAMFWFGTLYVANEIDTTVSNEIAEVEHSAGPGLSGLQQAVDSYARRAPPGSYYLLQDQSGRKLAGNMPPLEPILGLRNWGHSDRRQFPHALHGVRGSGVTVRGAYFFFGVDSFQLTEMREMIAQAFLWGLFGTIALALLGGTIMSALLLRRIEAISATTRDIIAGDMSRRIAIRGNDDEFDHLAVSLNAMLDRIESLMEGLRQVSNDIAHDLRTPLTRLRQRLELAQRRATSSEDLVETVERSIVDVDRILETFAGLLRIAQIEAQTRATAFEDIDLSALLGDMVEIYQSVAEDQGQRLTSILVPDLHINGHRELLPQMFSNLIENAIRHCPRGAAIAITLGRREKLLVASIADDGPGIPEDMRKKVLHRFVRLDRSRSVEGTGLGLSLVEAIAGLHHAQLRLLDNLPGLRVELVFPPSDAAP